MDAAGSGYPVRLDLEAPLTIARWRPLVNWILAIPQFIIGAGLQYLRRALLIVSFFLVLFTEQIPEQLFNLIVMTLLVFELMLATLVPTVKAIADCVLPSADDAWAMVRSTNRGNSAMSAMTRFACTSLALNPGWLTRKASICLSFSSGRSEQVT